MLTFNRFQTTLCHNMILYKVTIYCCIIYHFFSSITIYFIYFAFYSIYYRCSVPIIPEFLYDIRHPNATLDSLPRVPLTTPIPCDRPLGDTEVTTLSAGKFHSTYVDNVQFPFLCGEFDLN